VSDAGPLLTIDDVTVDYRRRGLPPLRAVAGVSLTVSRGEVVGLVGESGCGKSTLGRAAVGLAPVTGGTVTFDGRPVPALTNTARPLALRTLQMVFQDPYSSLNPRRRVGDQVEDGLKLSGKPSSAGQTPTDLLTRVGLPADSVGRYPHEFSGGQRQRIAIARALAAGPSCIIADEPISALDASAQAQVANLLVELVRELDVAMLFISHDLAVVRQIADRTAVMYLGEIVEIGATEAIWTEPAHPYTRALIDAVPRADGAGTLPHELPGDVPDPSRPPSGCRFHPRCPVVQPQCAQVHPASVLLTDGRAVRCVLQSDGEPVRPLPVVQRGEAANG
jgi:oligopeptide/dipeptide ABC transporter ATP-binding protein